MANGQSGAPAPAEYAPYYERYVSLVPEGDVVDTLDRQVADTLALLRGLSGEQGDHRYAPDKWTVKEVVGHMIDTERVFAFRALCFARGDAGPLPGFDQDVFAAHSDLSAVSLADLADELEHVRRSTVLLFRRLAPEAWARRGTASDAEVTVRALAHILAGHELYHVNILRSRYL